jgi:hypothetical protein
MRGRQRSQNSIKRRRAETVSPLKECALRPPSRTADTDPDPTHHRHATDTPLSKRPLLGWASVPERPQTAGHKGEPHPQNLRGASRAERLDGSGIRIGSTPAEKAPLLVLGAMHAVGQGSWQDLSYFTFVKTPCCYGWQIDGLNFSTTAVIRVLPKYHP